jgi:phosphate transport system substrate-binding protein
VNADGVNHVSSVLSKTAMIGRRKFICGLALVAARPGWAQILTPPNQRIDPRPALPGSIERETVAELPPYRPDSTVSAALRLWGHGNRNLPWMRNLVNLWEMGFRRFHPAAGIDYKMYGTSSGIPALFTGIGDIAILGEEILAPAAAAFERFKGYPPTAIEIMTGSLDVRNFDYAQQVFVHRDNPLEHLTLAQLDAILGAEHRRSDRNIRTWGELKLRGVWATRDIVPYSWAIDDSFGYYLQNAVLLGSHRWNPALREFTHITLADGSIYDHGQQILDALAKDPAGIAVSNIRYAGPDVKPIALGARDEGPFVQANKATLIDRSYPLARSLPAVIDRPPDMAVQPAVREFLRYVISRDGQAMVAQDGRYLPLAAAVAARQARMLA